MRPEPVSDRAWVNGRFHVLVGSAAVLAVVALGTVVMSSGRSVAGGRVLRPEQATQTPTAAPLELVERARFAASDATDPAPVRYVQLDDPYAYVLNAAGRLRVFDIANRSAPREVGGLTLDTGDTVVSLGGEGNALYALESAPAEYRLDVIDITVPTTPRLVRPVALVEAFGSLTAMGQRLYLGGPDGLLILDASNPLSPLETGHYRRLDVDIGDLATDGRMLYAIATVQQAPDSDATGRGLLVLDVRSATGVTARREYYDTKLERTTHMALAQGALAIGGEQGLLTLSVDEHSILPFGLYEPPTLPWDWASSRYTAVISQGEYVYAARNGPTGSNLRVIDFFDSTLPIELATFDLHDDTVTWIDADGELVAVGTGEDGVLLLAQKDRRPAIATQTPAASPPADHEHQYLPFAFKPRRAEEAAPDPQEGLDVLRKRLSVAGLWLAHDS